MALAGFVAGALLTGLVVPFAVGEPREEVAITAPGSAGPIQSGAVGPGGGTATENGSAPATADPTAIAAAGEGQSTSSPAPGVAAPPPGDPGPLPPQEGVSETEILVGIPIINTSDAASAIGIQVEGAPDQRAIWQAFIDQLNVEGIHGRTVTPVYVSYNAFDPADARRACNELTEDRGVFAVLAYSFYADAGTCVTVQHQTILLNVEAQHEEAFRASEGRLFTQIPNANRLLRIQALELERLGELQGRRLGILTSEGGNDHMPVRESLVPTLRELGHDVAHVTTLSADFGVAQSQIVLEVAQMRQAGVQVVFLAANGLHVARFAQEADRQGWRPTYMASDYAGSVQEFLTATYPGSFEGIGVTSRRYGEQRTGAAEPAKDAACRQTFELATGTSFARGSSNYQLVLQFCSTVLDMLRPGLLGAGRALTTSTFSTALQSAGTFDLAFASRSSFGAGKFDAADFIRTVRFRQDCRCWVPADEFRAAPA